MDCLTGEALDEVWPRTTQSDRDGLADQLGEAVATLHELPPPTIERWQPTNWDRFVVDQRAGCVEHQRACGLAETWLKQIPGLLD